MTVVGVSAQFKNTGWISHHLVRLLFKNIWDIAGRFLLNLTLSEVHFELGYLKND